MHFFAPTALFFAAAIPVVIVFYLLKRRRTAHLVPSTLLWQRFLAESQASAPFQKLRHNWLLILQLLMLVLVIAALARPYFRGAITGGRLQVVILDGSASMQSTDEAPSRFEKARAGALGLVDALRDGSQMVVLGAGANTEVLQSATGEKASLRRALGSARVTDAGTHLKEALRLAATLIRDRPDAEIHLFSDGVAGELEEFENKNLPVIYHKVGVRGDNVGVVSLDAKAHPEDPTRRALFTSVANHSDRARTVQMDLLFDGRMLESKTLELAPGETVPQVFTAEQPYDGVFTVRIAGADDLAADNEASVVSLLPTPVKVLLLTRGNRFLERALRAVPQVELSIASDLDQARPPQDFVVLDDVTPSVWPEVNVLAIHVAATNWFEVTGQMEAPPVVDWKFNHPLLRFVKFDNVQVAEAVKVSLPGWGTAVVESSDAPLVIAGELGRQRIVWISFETLNSTWPLRVSFPIFVANAVDYLNPSSARSSRLNLQAGTPLRWPMAETVTEATVTKPDGTKAQVTVDARSAELVFGDTARRGVYRLRVGTNEFPVCVNLLDGAESLLKPRDELKFGEYVTVAATQERRANLEFWRWVAAAGLAVLLYEWWFYHRRTA